MSNAKARAAFEEGVADRYEEVPKMDTKVVSDPKVAVPGFTTFESFVGKHSVRGWAREDGTTVFMPTIEFGPLLDALQLRDNKKSAKAREIAERLAWAHGPSYVLVERVAKGECGAKKELIVPPERDPKDDGGIEFRFALKKKDKEVIQYRVLADKDGEYDIQIYQLAPR